jgi:hypothetical protein
MPGQTISNIYQEKYSAPIMTQLSEDAKQYRDPNDRIIDEIGLIVVRLNDLCASLKDGSLTQPSEIIRRTLSLDADLMSVLLTAPPAWNYTTVKVPLVNGEPITNLVWGDSYHIYRNLAVSSMWNNARSARILMYEMILEAVKQFEESSSANSGHHHSHMLANQSREIARQLVDDICASVPFHMGMGVDDNCNWEVSSDESSNAPFGSSVGTDAADPTILSNPSLMASGPHSLPHAPPSFEISGAGGVTMVWPLLIAANSGHASLELRKWITKCLDRIGHSMGINQALAMAQLLRDGMHSRAWISPEGSPVESSPTSL